MNDQEKDFLEDTEIEEDVKPTKIKKQLSEQKLQHLTKVCGVSKHVYEKKFRNIPVTVWIFFVLDRSSNGRAFFRNNFSFFSRGLAGTNGSDKVPVKE